MDTASIETITAADRHDLSQQREARSMFVIKLRILNTPERSCRRASSGQRSKRRLYSNVNNGRMLNKDVISRVLHRADKSG